jgi:hypothetical protein
MVTEGRQVLAARVLAAIKKPRGPGRVHAGLRRAQGRDWAQITKDLKPVYTAVSESEALDQFADFSGK